MVLNRFHAFQPDPRSTDARLCFVLDCVDGALQVTHGDVVAARGLIAVAGETCDWGRVTPAFNYFGLPQGDLHGWLFCVLEPDASCVGGVRLIMRPFGRFSGAAASFAAALQAGAVPVPSQSALAELNRLIAVAPQTIAARLQPLRALSGLSPANATTQGPVRDGSRC
jgi:hypothetical protein